MEKITDLKEFLAKKIESLVGLKGGFNQTFFEIIAVQPTEIVNYPSIKDGKELHYSLFDTDKEHLEYWNNKTKVISQGYVLTVTGNAISAESTLQDMGFKAFANGPNSVQIS